MDNSVDYITSFSELSIGDSGLNVTKLPEFSITQLTGMSIPQNKMLNIINKSK